MDKYVEELEKAKEKASFIPNTIWWKIPCFRFLGAVQGKYGIMYYYYDEMEDTYYYESDFDREMRAKVRKNRFKNYAKK